MVKYEKYRNLATDFFVKTVAENAAVEHGILHIVTYLALSGKNTT